MNDNIKGYLQKMISEYLDASYLDDVLEEYLEEKDTDDTSDAIKARIGADELANHLANEIGKNVLTFNSSEFLDALCDSCGKPYGEFVSASGWGLDPYTIMQNGKRIVIIDDL